MKKLSNSLIVLWILLYLPSYSQIPTDSMQSEIIISDIITNSISAQSNDRAGNQDFPTPVAKVDERVELLTIVARLADFSEYSGNVLEDYTNDIEEHFSGHKDHSLIRFIKELRVENGLGYDAVMQMAVLLKPPPELTPRVDLIAVLDDRWGGEEKIAQFLVLIQQFYRESNFEGFYDSHRGLYSLAEERFQAILNEVDFSWFGSFYGNVPGVNFNFYVRLQTGGSYGPSVELSENRTDIYAILGTTEVESDGTPMYSESRLQTIIHEFSHSFVNPIFFKHMERFRPSGEKIFEAVRNDLSNRGYGNWESIVIESLVRASVIRYRIEHESDPNIAFDRIITEKNFGFIWIDELVVLLGAYQHSKAYKNFDSLLPLIIGYFDDLESRMGQELSDFDKNAPHVLEISPIDTSMQNVKASTKEIVITFDKPVTKSDDFMINPTEAGEDAMPVINIIELDELGIHLILKTQLLPHSNYEFLLPGSKIKSLDGYRMKDYTLKFRTNEN
ncbi:MAG: DUF4932 domain-containing protein [Cyclobacteriaceae bacterium]